MIWILIYLFVALVWSTSLTRPDKYDLALIFLWPVLIPVLLILMFLALLEKSYESRPR